ncbi:MAG: class I SAM-dependent methyltransferase [Phycisphaerae bacterium]|nr:class I SAM-dependent methyltransferase [Phycisphaerae bacterium]
MAWYENFFDDWYLKYWIQPITQQRTNNEVDAIIDYLKINNDSNILDLCCGQGRHSLELARRGFKNVNGLDLSETLLGFSKESAKKENLAINFIQGDMRDIPASLYDGIFNFYTAFGYFEKDEENQAVLDAVGRALKPGGYFLLDYPLLEGRMGPWQNQEFFEYEDGTVMLHEMIHNVFDQEIVNKVLYITKDNLRHRTGFTLRHYYGRELRKCLRKAGMEVVATFGSLEGNPLTARDRRVLIQARKIAEPDSSK